MALSNKPRPGTTHKKIKAQHHKHSKSYVKTYWPYMPVVAIIGLGLMIDHFWHTGVSMPQAKLVNYTYYDVLESSIGGIALAIFMLRHAFAWHKVLIKGEDFVAHHPLLDIALVFVATFSLILSQHHVSFI